MKLIFLFIALFFILQIVACSEVNEQYKPVILTDETFQNAVNKPGLWFIKYYAPWCGHCKALAPVWEELAERIHKMNEHMMKEDERLYIGSVDCTSNKETCKQAHVAGYPTLMLFNKGKQVTEYQGPRTVSGLAGFLKDMLSQDKSEGKVIEMDSSTYSRDSLRINSHWLVHMYNDASGIVGLQHVLNELAKQYDDSTVFISQLNCDKNNDICKRYGITKVGQNKIYLFSGNQIKPFKGDVLEVTQSQLASFIDQGMVDDVTHRPVLEQDNSAFYQMVLAIIIGIVVMFVVLCTIVMCCLDENDGDDFVDSDDEGSNKKKKA